VRDEEPFIRALEAKKNRTLISFFDSFEHSLVQELGYNGYERLRRGFDRSFGGQESVPKFPLVVDAGCGTGLVGEQVSQEHFAGIFLMLRSWTRPQTVFHPSSAISHPT
jgi:hypothetical protein